MGRLGKWSEDPCGDWHVKELEVLDSDNLVEMARMQERREEVLAKLSEEDRKILGF